MPDFWKNIYTISPILFIILIILGLILISTYQSLAGVLIGSGITFFVTYFYNRYEHVNKEKSLEKAIKLDLKSNILRSKANIDEIEKGIIHNEYSIKSPNLLSTGYWDLIKYNYSYLPEKLAEQSIFEKIMDSALKTQQINETIHGRENYISSIKGNEANENRMNKFNGYLKELNQDLIQKLDKLLEFLD